MTTLAQTTLALAKRYGIGGARWVVTRADSSGVTQTIGTATPLYVRQRKLSTLERVLAGSAATAQTDYTAYWSDDTMHAPTTGDTITSGALAFLITATSTTDRPGITQATLERQPYV
jgi:hypothetical protein